MVASGIARARTSSKPPPAATAPGARQRAVGQVLVPRPVDPPRQLVVLHHECRPIGVPHQHAPARPQRPVQLGERGARVGHVLHTCTVKAASNSRRPRRARWRPRRAAPTLDKLAAARPGRPIIARSGRRRRPSPTRPLGELAAVEAGAAADVEDPLALPRRERLADLGAPDLRFPDEVDGLHAPRLVFVEDQLAHDATAIQPLACSRMLDKVLEGGGGPAVSSATAG